MKTQKKLPNLAYILVLAYVVVVLFLPNFIKNYTIIYSINAEKYIPMDEYVRGNPWLYYSFTIIEVLAVIYGLLHKPRKNDIDLRWLFGFLILHNLLRLLFDCSNIFEFGDYSLILSLLVGYGCYQLIINRPLNMNLEDAFDLVIILNAITQVLFIVTGRVKEYGGRYAALGSEVGEVGMMCFTYILYFIFAREKKSNSIFPFFCCIFSLIVSGSRSNILFLILFIILFSFQYKKGMDLSEPKRKTIKIFITSLIFIVPILLYINIGNNAFVGKVINRITDFTVSFFGQSRAEYLQADQSFTQRIKSFAVGMQIIKENPLGIATSSIDLQMRTQANGYYTFPHSNLISYYLLWGVSALFIYFKMIKTTIDGIKRKKTAWVIIACLVIVFIVYGGPIINLKAYFWYIAMFAFCKKSIYAEDEKMQLQNAL